MNISVIVPTFNREELLGKCLKALSEQSYPRSSYEILVCDDGSTDNTREAAKEFKAEHGAVNIRYLSQKNQGPAATRNMGIRHARGRIVALTDDDCEPDNDWLEQIDRVFRKNKSIVGVGGVTYSIPEKITPLTHQIENNEPWSFPTCNAAYLKKMLHDIGGFDPIFPFTNEDADISWRIERVGKVIHNTNMTVLHPPRPTTARREIRTIRYLNSEFLLWRKMPEEYRKRRGNPYLELLYVHGVKIAIKRMIKHSRWALKNPFVYLKLVLVVLVQRLYLIALLPKFALESRRAKRSEKPR